MTPLSSRREPQESLAEKMRLEVDSEGRPMHFLFDTGHVCCEDYARALGRPVNP